LHLTKQSILLLIKSNPILYRLAHGTFWTLLGTVASRVFALISTIFIARLLGVEDFGAYGMVQSTLEMFGLFAGFSLGVTSSKYLAEYKTRDKNKASRVLSLTNTFSIISSTIIGLVIYFSSSWLASETLKRPDLAPLLSLGAMYLIISTQNNVLIGALGGFEAFKETAKINSLQGMLTPVFAIPLVYFYGLQGAVLSLIAISLVGYALCRTELNKKCSNYGIVIQRFDISSFREWPVLWHFSIPSLASGILVMPVIWFTNTILVNQQNGYAELGLFNAANQWRQLIIFIPQILSTVMLPILSAAFGDAKKETFGDALRINLILTWVIALPMTIFIISIREPLTGVFGKTYEGMEMLLIILMVTSFLSMINAVIGTALAGSGKMWLGTMMNLGWAIALILLTIMLVPVYGGLGLALAYLLAYSLHTCWTMIYADIYLAHRLIRNQKLLIILTAITIFPLLVLTFMHELKLTAMLVILMISILPCGRLLKREYGKLKTKHVEI
jgi:O-antigen/teichoic acid export membrane protein